MAISLKHLFQSAKADGPDNTIVQPSDWNDEHVLTLDEGKIVGRAAGAGAGAAQELPVSVATDGSTIISGSSSNAMLRITQTGAGNALVVEDSANPDATPFVVDTNGRVVAGNTAGVNFASGYFPQIQTLGSTSSTSANGIARFSADAGSSTFAFVKSRSATVGSYSSVVSSGDGIGTIQFFADDGTTSPKNAAQIQAVVDGTPGDSDMPGRLVFSTTADGASSPTERMRIDSYGSVGIGTTTAIAQSLRVGRNITGNVNSMGVRSIGVVQSDVTSSARGFDSGITTAAASFTITNLHHYYAAPATFGAGSTVTNQYGYFAESNLTGATNNYGFYGNIPDGTGRWNFYANGTAPNYFNGVTTFTKDVLMTGTGGLEIPAGTTAQRPSAPTAGYVRYNTTTGKFEGYSSAWGNLGGGATGGGSDDLFIENGQTVTTDYTITAGKNAGTFGPITINSGVTVTVPSGSTWTVV